MLNYLHINSAETLHALRAFAIATLIALVGYGALALLSNSSPLLKSSSENPAAQSVRTESYLGGSQTSASPWLDEKSGTDITTEDNAYRGLEDPAEIDYTALNSQPGFAY